MESDGQVDPNEKRRELEYYGNQIILEQFLGGLVSPIRSFPPELLSLIFTYACAGDNDLDTRFALTRVCQRWRKVALDTPLWTNLEIQVVNWGPSRFKIFGVNDVPAYVRECIRRAKNRPILFQWQEEYAHLSKVDNNWLQTLIPSLPQVLYNAFTWLTPSYSSCSFSSLFDSILASLRTKSTRSLQGLSLSNYDRDHCVSQTGADHFMDLTAIKRLSKLRLSLSSGFVGGNLKLRESSLTVLTIDSGGLMRQTDILQMLQRCVNLEAFTLKSVHFDRDAANAMVIPQVLLSKLCMMYLFCKTHMMFLGLLCAMKTPFLAHLTPHLKCDSRIIAFESFKPFFSNCINLEYLWISGIASKQDVVDVLAPRAPRLKELGIMINGDLLHSVSRSKSVYGALDALRVQARRPVLFPSLVAFQLICEADQRIVHTFNAIIVSRGWHQFPRPPGATTAALGVMTMTNSYS